MTQCGSKSSVHDGDGQARGEMFHNDGEWTIVVEIPMQTMFTYPVCAKNFSNIRTYVEKRGHCVEFECSVLARCENFMVIRKRGLLWYNHMHITTTRRQR